MFLWKYSEDICNSNFSTLQPDHLHDRLHNRVTVQQYSYITAVSSALSSHSAACQKRYFDFFYTFTIS
jgi:hypothetical protein